MASRSSLAIIISLFFRGIWQSIPHIFAFIKLAFWSYIMTIASLWTGIPKATHALSKDWESFVMDRGLDSIYAHKFYWVCRILATVIIIAEWISFSFVTVFLVMLFT